MGKKVIITGSTGMVGKAVLIECLESKEIESILVINRHSINMKHPKLKEIIHSDFLNIEPIKEQLKGYDACFYCLGVSSLGLNEQKYTEITYSMTESFVNTLDELNPDMVFNYVSGTGTDSSEKGRIMWARVKGKTENMIFKKGFKDAYAFRPGIILPEKGVKSKTGWYNFFYIILRPFFPLLKLSKSVTLSSKVGMVMIHTILHPQELKVLENRDINKLAEQS